MFFNIGNRFSSTTIVVPLTDAAYIRKPSPIYVRVRKGDGEQQKTAMPCATKSAL
jgi:hypothetical protein